MSITNILSTLEKMATLHAYLYELTVRKEDIVKENKLEDLQELTLEEKKYAKAIAQLEQQRKLLSEKKTVTELLEDATPDEQKALLDVRGRLADTIGKIQRQNELNQQLLQQSLQFVTMTMNTINPQPSAVTYDKPANTKKTASAPSRSLFDSKA
jgi:flagellar biosynthesis/type III secretory pathway chaperone